MKTPPTYILLQILSLGLIFLQIYSTKVEYAPCVDKYHECVLWKKANLCSDESYKDYLTFNCPVTCGICENPKKKNDIGQTNTELVDPKINATSQTNETKPLQQSIKNIPSGSSLNATTSDHGFIITNLFNSSSYDVPSQNDSNSTHTSSSETSSDEQPPPETEENEVSKRSHVSFKQKFANALLHNKPYFNASIHYPFSTFRSVVDGKNKQKYQNIAETNKTQTDEPVDVAVTTVSPSSGEANGETITPSISEPTDINDNNTEAPNLNDNNTEAPNLNDNNTEAPNLNENNTEAVNLNENNTETSKANDEEQEDTTANPTDSEQSTPQPQTISIEPTLSSNNPQVFPLNVNKNYNNNNILPTISLPVPLSSSEVVTMQPYSYSSEVLESCDTRKFKMDIKNNYCDTLQDENSPKYKMLRGNINKDIPKFIALDAVIVDIEFPLECEEKKNHQDTTVIISVCANRWTINRFKRLFSTGKVGDLLVVPNTLFEVLE